MNSLHKFFVDKGIQVKDSSAEFIEIYVVAKTGVKKERMEVLDSGELKVCVRAKPIEGEANRAIQKTIAKSWGLSKGQVELLKGEKSPRKLFRVRFSFTGDKAESYYRKRVEKSLSH